MRVNFLSTLFIVISLLLLISAHAAFGQVSHSQKIRYQNLTTGNLILSNSVVRENKPNGTVIGYFHVIGKIASRHNYHFSLTDNANNRFSIVDSSLKVKNTNLIHYKSNQFYTITVKATDSNGHSIQKDFSIKILKADKPPTNIILSNQRIAENSPGGTFIAHIIGTDPDSSDKLTYSLVKNPRNSFTIYKNNLVVADSAHIDYEKTPLLPVTIRATDLAGESLDKSFIIHVQNRNDPPTVIHLSNTSIKEDSPMGTYVGIFSTVDEDSADSFDYDLLNNAKGAFALFGNALVVADSARLNYEADSTLTIKVRSTDEGGLSVVQPLTIHIKNINEPPRIVGIKNLKTREDIPTDTLYFTINDPETPSRFLTILTNSSNTDLVADSNIVLGGSNKDRWIFIRSDHDSSGTANIDIKVSDGVNITRKKLKLTVQPVNDYPVIAVNKGLKLNEGTGKILTPQNLDVTDVDNTNKELMFRITELPEHGTLFKDTTRIRKNGIFSQYDINHGIIKYVHDGSETVSDRFKFNISDGSGGKINKQYFDISINPVNDPPTMTEIPNVTTLEDTPTRTIPFKIHDEETPASYLELSTSSTNSGLLPDSSIILGGIGQNRTITMNPAPNQNGSTLVSVVVSDGQAHKVDHFKLTVKPVDDPPFIDPIANQKTRQGQPVTIKFKIGDIDTDVSKLKVWAATSDENLIPKENIQFLGSGSTRKMIIKPGMDIYGKDKITLFCSDGDSTTKSSFNVNVKKINKPPDVFSLYHSDTYVNNDTVAIKFAWQKAVDSDHNPITYILHIKGNNYDTTITGIKAEKYTFTDKKALRPNSLYDWFVSATDGKDTTRCLLAKDFVAPKIPEIPQKYSMSPNYPNPFNPVTTIHYKIPIVSQVTLSIYDALGRKVTELVNKQQTPGSYDIQWNAQKQASGVYIYQLIAISNNGKKHFVDTRKMLLVK